MPPPRPQKLNIPTPKCTFSRQNPNIKMTPDEIKQYYKWVSGATIKAHSKVHEASLVQQTPKISPKYSAPIHSAYVSAGYIPKAIPDLITYQYAAAGYPIKQT